jgi:hypothetical protein
VIDELLLVWLASEPGGLDERHCGNPVAVNASPSPKCLHDPGGFAESREEANGLDAAWQVTGPQQLAPTNRTPSAS